MLITIGRQEDKVMGKQKQKISYALEYKGDKTIKVKAIAKECCIRIDIPGKTFAQIRLKVERAVYPSKKSALKKAIFKTLRGEGVLIRIFIQNELNSYYEEFITSKDLKNSNYPYIKNYREQEGRIESFFDIVMFWGVEKIAEAAINTLVEDFIIGFKKRIKKKLEDLLNPEGKSDCIIIDITNGKALKDNNPSTTNDDK